VVAVSSIHIIIASRRKPWSLPLVQSKSWIAGPLPHCGSNLMKTHTISIFRKTECKAVHSGELLKQSRQHRALLPPNHRCRPLFTALALFVREIVHNFSILGKEIVHRAQRPCRTPCVNRYVALPPRRSSSITIRRRRKGIAIHLGGIHMTVRIHSWKVYFLGIGGI
jgi:hypothetical protein